MYDIDTGKNLTRILVTQETVQTTGEPDFMQLNGKGNAQVETQPTAGENTCQLYI